MATSSLTSPQAMPKPVLESMPVLLPAEGADRRLFLQLRRLRALRQASPLLPCRRPRSANPRRGPSRGRVLLRTAAGLCSRDAGLGRPGGGRVWRSCPSTPPGVVATAARRGRLCSGRRAAVPSATTHDPSWRGQGRRPFRLRQQDGPEDGAHIRAGPRRAQEGLGFRRRVGGAALRATHSHRYRRAGGWPRRPAGGGVRTSHSFRDRAACAARNLPDRAAGGRQGRPAGPGRGGGWPWRCTAASDAAHAGWSNRGRRDSSVAGRPTGPRSSRAAAARAARSLLGRRPCSRERIRRRAGGAIPATRCVRVRRGSPCQPRLVAAAAACAACCTRGRRAAGWPRRCTAYAARASRGHRGRTSRRGSCWPRRSVAAAAAVRAGRSNRGRRARRCEGGRCCAAAANAASAASAAAADAADAADAHEASSYSNQYAGACCSRRRRCSPHGDQSAAAPAASEEAPSRSRPVAAFAKFIRRFAAHARLHVFVPREVP